ncbi:MAG: peptidoglycan DD-metalloendopeptidase family protein [Alphaproteobacteria bacterium]|nr:peptidoglycan DD-metalloendopeptidase family protein [Alphaproteobacteria bacterium]
MRGLTRGCWVATACLLAACATTPPAPVVTGKIQQNWQTRAPRQTAAFPTPPASATAVPLADGATSPAAITGLTTVQPVVPVINEETLQQVQPAAGPTQPVAPRLNTVPASGFQTIQVDAAKPAAPQVTTYTVQPTDTLFKIARAHQTTPEAIVRANGLRNVADVEPGRTLTIPANTKPNPPSLADSITNYLRTAPTPAAPAAPVATTAEPAVEPATPGQQNTAETTPTSFDVARIEPAAGRELPAAKPVVPAKQLQHQVKSGETIFRISKHYKVSVLDIMAANDLERPEALQAGMVLNIPTSPTVAQAKQEARAAVREAKAVTPGLRPAADLGVTEATRATILASQTAALERPLNDPDKGTDTADTVRPLRPVGPITEKDKLRAELKRGQIDREAAKQRGLIWPARGELLKKFGEKGNGVAHTGINIAVPANTPVLATEDGTVLYADNGLRAYGNMVLIRHPGGMVSAYAHTNHLLVRKGERVQKGQVIAVSGQTGNVESPQLHFELRRNATAIDPLTVLPK